jgi:hypothetical protein
MKKIIITLFCAGIFVASFAQDNGRTNDRDDRYAYNQRGDHGKNFLSERDRRIEQINHEFDFKIRAIENNYTLRRHQKKVAIRNAEAERRMQIRNVKFNRDRRHHDADWDHDGDRH